PRRSALSVERRALYWTSVAAFVLVPLIFTTSVYRVYSLPKFTVLLVVSSVIAVLLTLNLKRAARDKVDLLGLVRSRHVFLVFGFLVAMSVSTVFGTAPLSSFFGSVYNQMGLLTHVGYLLCFVGLIVGVATNQALLTRAIWAFCLTGFVVAAYGVSQFFGFDPLFWSGLYTSSDQQGSVLRSVSTLGHSNYLGNFLLYTTPLSLGLSLTVSPRLRLVGLSGSALCLMAIVVSGTRGAWVGIVAGIVVFAIVERQSLVSRLSQLTQTQVLRRTAVAFLALVVVGFVISLSNASHSVVTRAKSFANEGFTGAGRTILWRDTIRMLPSVVLLGTGPEGFRKAFLAYKSKDLARLEPTANNESAHNSYLDALISYGLPGALLYLAMIASAGSLFLKARRRTTDRTIRLVITGLLSSLAAVLVHNFFIYNQISTGLYFFGVLAFAQILANLSEIDRSPQAVQPKGAAVSANPSKSGSTVPMPPAWVANAGLGVASVCLLASVWYSAGLVEADATVREIIVAARAGDFNQVVEHSQHTAASPDPTGTHEFLAISLLAQIAPGFKSKSIAGATALEPVHDKCLELAISLSPRPLAHTLTPELVHVMLAYLASTASDHARLREYASGALRWDPNNYEGHLMLARSYMAQGEKEKAVAEAELALEIKPSSSEALHLKQKASRSTTLPKSVIERIIKRSQARAKAGDTRTARASLLRAIRLAESPCPECHRELALVYEKENLRAEAIAEWQKYLQLAVSAADAQLVRERIAALEQHSSTAKQPAR
ncbi:MAG TPA: O-antigen ligase family protein, partial [Blastocatellia bacterium]|nr:O-antigen ligase family protein [Blastocatellia bacterium]